MKSTLLVFLVVLPLIIWGQFGGQHIIYDASKYIDINAADLDNDGDQDIVAISVPDQKVVWFENIDGKGNFGQQQILTLSLNSNIRITIGDVDQDNDIDVLISAIEGLVLYINDNGKFCEQFLSRDSFMDAAICDINGDQKLDIIALLRGSIILFEDIGNDSSFSSETIIETIDDGKQIELSDINNDSFDDIVFIAQRECGWFSGNGNGDFGEKNIISDAVSQGNHLQLGDIDEDNDVDIVCTIGGEIVIYENTNGVGNFGSEQIISDNLRRVDDIELIDIDKDEDLDIVFIGDTNPIVGCYKNTPTDRFSELSVFTRLAIFQSLAIAHFDEDDKLDFAVTQSPDYAINWFRQENDLQFQFQENIADTFYNIRSTLLPFPSTKHPNSLYTLLSGKPSIISIEDNGFNNLKFGKPNLIESPVCCANVIGTLDIENDGDEDIVGIGSNGENIVVFSLAQDENFKYFYQEITTGEFQYLGWKEILHTIDINNNGKEDILFTFNDRSRIGYYKNLEGESLFSELLLLPESIGHAPDIIPNDLDQDGDLDLVIESEKGIFLFEYDTNSNSFLDPIRLELQSDGQYTIAVKDMNNDGNTDLLVFYRNLRSFFLYSSTTGSLDNFEANLYLENVIASTDNIYLEDLDSDRDIDILFEEGGGVIYWYENLGGTNDFDILKKIFTTSDLNNFFVNEYIFYDIDQDQDLDIILTSAEGSRISWLENISNDPSIAGTFFLDENQNTQFDSTELPLQNFNIHIAPNALESYTNTEGKYKFFLSSDTYIIKPEIPEGWQLTSDSDNYIVEIDSNYTLEKNFGFIPISDTSLVQSYLTSSPTRCGFEVNFWLDYQNNGGQTETGAILIIKDDRTQLTYIDVPEGLTGGLINGDTTFWKYNKLPPTYGEQMNFRLQMPGVESIGDTLKIKVLSYVEDEVGNLQLTDVYHYSSEIRCAYDPNDKLVSPNRNSQYDQNYTLFDEELEYSIRFQNTGTDTAFTVIIRDSLDVNLDWKTFKPIASSHKFETLLQSESGVLEFIFKNILLPDSTTNEAASQGYIKYRIKVKKNLVENTNIQNTANIIFDFNPPIRTNTIENTMVSKLPKTNNSSQFTSNIEIKTYPNPFEDYFTIEIKNTPTRNHILHLLNSSGQYMRSYLSTADKDFQINTANLPVGLYFYQLIDSDQSQILANGKLVKIKN